MDAITSGRSGARPRLAAGDWPRPALLVAGLLLLALAGRLITYPLQHDELFYLPPALLLQGGGLYQDIGFTHLPNLPLLLNGLVELSGPENVLLVGRALVLAAWVGLLLVLVRGGRMLGAGKLAMALATALLLFNTDLLGEAGMAATNNFVPYPFALAGILLFIAATRDQRRAVMLAAVSGLLLALAAGFKANFAPLILPVGLAALLVPLDWTLRERLVRLAAPMLVGGLIGALPTLMYFAQDPQGFLIKVVEAHRGPQIAYWLANADPADPKVMGAAAKLIFARDLWLGGTTVLMLISTAVLLLLLLRQTGHWRAALRSAGWETGLLLSIVLLAALLCFLPTPAFPQYYVLPLPFGALLILLLHGRLDDEQRRTAHPVLVAALALAALGGAPSLFAKPLGLLQPEQWASSKLHDDSRRLADALGPAAPGATVATLEPLPVLVGNMRIVPELALGPFLYRAADYMPPAQRRHFRLLASPRTASAVLRARQPAAILTSRSPALDAPLVAYATANGYRPVELPWRSAGGARTRTLFLAPAQTQADR